MADNNGKVTRLTLPRYSAEGADNFEDREGCECHACRRQRRRHTDRASTSVVARRIATLCIGAAVVLGILYGFGETLTGQW